ncbi:conserved membrane hypothetical protein [Vibrio chagasii]|nr:conserved membrane hypothetical protein [Vibrio chagasii]CAH7411680.1 conserved membrane hypothetical protein [Vibrio chagasii]
MVFDAKKFISTLFIVITFVSLYFLDRDRTNASNLLILNSILSIFTFISLVFFPYAYRSILRYNISLYDVGLLTILITSFVLTVFFRKYINVHWVYLIGFLIISYFEVKNINVSLLKVLIGLAIISICYQLLTSESVGRRTLTYIDPNYSSMVIYFLGILCLKLKYRTFGYLILSLGLLTLSRNYMLALIVFFTVQYVCRRDIIHRFICSFFRPWVILLIVCILPVAINLWFLSVASMTDVVTNSADTKLSGSLIDSSNLHRSLANIRFVEDLGSNPMKYIFGSDSGVYIENIFMNTPHHAVFQMVLNYGYIFTLAYLLLFFKRCYQSCRTSKFNTSFYSGLITYFMILGGGINGIFVYMIALVLVDFED